MEGIMKNIYSLWVSILLSFMLFPAVALSFTAEEVEQMADIGLRVNLEGTAMVEVKPDDDPSRIKQTRLLDLSGKSLHRIPPWLGEFTNLRLLDLSGNRLMADDLPELFTALQNMPELDVFNLSNNPLFSGSDEPSSSLGSIWQNLPKLGELYLNQIGANGAELGDFSPLTQLSILELRSNRLDSLAEVQGLNALAALRQLDLSDNTISSLNYHVPLQFNHLDLLGLSKNRLGSLAGIDGLHCPALLQLNLSHNQLSDVSALANAGAALANIDLLNLSHNRLTVFKADDYNRLPRLRILDVSHNRISSFQAGGEIESLGKLVISSNSLSKIGFIDMPNLLKWQMLDNNGRISLAEDYDDPFTMTNLIVFDCGDCPVLSEAFRKKQKRAEEKYNKEKVRKRKAEFQGKCLHKTPPYGQQYRDETGMEFMWVPCGCFMMGDIFKEGDNDEQPEHVVCLQGFYLGKYEVTQGQWQKIMGDNPSKSGKGDAYPVDSVSWNDVQEFIGKLNRQSGKEYSLPSEAQWEYAASWRPDGSKARFGNGKDIADPAEMNFDGSKDYKKSYSKVGVYRRKTVPVDSFSPNALGLYNMSGNVYEWCQDRWHNNYKDAPDDGSAWESGDGSYRVIRGGSWLSNPWWLRAAYRFRYWADNCGNIVGFRLLLPVQ